jgi:hypothetical protein
MLRPLPRAFVLSACWQAGLEHRRVDGRHELGGPDGNVACLDELEERAHRAGEGTTCAGAARGGVS